MHLQRAMLLLLLLLPLMSDASADDVTLFADCNIGSVPVHGVNCSGLHPILEDALRSIGLTHTRFVLTDNQNAATMVLKLSFTQDPQTNTILYVFRYLQRASGGAWNVSRVSTIRVSLGGGVTSAQHFLDIVRRTTFDLVDLTGNFAVPVFQNGTASLRLREPFSGGARPSQSPWAFSPSGSLNFSFADSTSGGAALNLSLLGSWPRHVFRAHAGGRYDYSSIQLPDGQTLTGEAWSTNGSVLYVFSLADVRGQSIWRRFGIDFGVRARRAPIDNFDVMAGGSVGLEWNLRPMISEGSDPNFSIRYTVSAEYQRYLTQTIRRRNDDAVFAQTLQAAGRFHWTKLDITLFGQLSTLLDSDLYPELTAGTSVEYRPVPALSFIFDGSLTWQPNQAYHAWIAPPESLGILATQTGFPVISANGGLRIRVVLGNASVNVLEQRGR